MRVSDYPQLGEGEGSTVATTYVRVFSDEEVNRHGYIIPTASFTVSVHGLTVSVDGSASNELNDRIVKYQWDFDDDMFVDYEDSRPESHWTYPRAGDYTIGLYVFDASGFRSNLATETVTLAGGPCVPPSCPGSVRGNRAFAAVGERLPFSATLTGKTLKARLLDLPGKPSWAERTLRSFLKTSLRPKLKESGSTSTGLALATGRKKARLCLRVSFTVLPDKTPAGTLDVLGGTKAAARLRATAAFRFGGGRLGSAVGLGNVRTSRGKARPLPKACAKLARVGRG